MRVLVCGGRNFQDQAYLYKMLNAEHKRINITLLIEGGANGADSLARTWAIERGIPYETHRAKWKEYGKAAGSVRNSVMLKVGLPELVIAFPGGVGTADMLYKAKMAGIPCIQF